MKRFNPEKELYKIQHGNRNKLLYSIILLLLIISIGSTYALYQVRYSKRIIYTKVAPFSNDDIELAVYLDGTPQTSFPKQESVYYDSVTCDNDPDAYAKWDYDNWRLKELNVSVPNKCNLNFTKKYRDKSGANAPELYQGLIPVTFDANGKVYAVNLEEEWYDYDDKRWANAVLVDNSKEEIKTKYFNEDGSLKEIKETQEIPMEEILQMYVWIPRYKYQLFNAINRQSKSPQEIQIKFESGTSSTGEATCEISTTGVETCTNATNGNWYTHPAFSFGNSTNKEENTQLKGIWIGKFETSGTVDDIQILPNEIPIVNQTLSSMFNASRYIEEQNAKKFNLDKEEIDTHVMKNMEWGAMAYLTQSKYGRCTDGTCVEVTVNSQTNKTGYDNSGNLWYTSNGMKASTTGNEYGIYDTKGSAWESVMANMVDSSGNFYASYAGNSFYVDEETTSSLKPEEKYYDKYQYGTTIESHERGHLGDATRETMQTFGNITGAWYGGCAVFTHNGYGWLSRDTKTGVGSAFGIFTFHRSAGEEVNTVTFRTVLTETDTNEKQV